MLGQKCEILHYIIMCSVPNKHDMCCNIIASVLAHFKGLQLLEWCSIVHKN